MGVSAMRTEGRSSARARRWRASPLSLVVSGLCLLGVLVLVYPAVASWFSAVQQAEQVSELAAAGYGTGTRSGPIAQDEQIAAAHRYNQALTSGAAVAANTRIPVANDPSTAGAFDYRSLLAADAHGLMGRIQIPAIAVDLPIYHSTSEAVLVKGVGHLEGTALPVGGPGTHSVLAAHRGLASSTLFTDLDKVVVGDGFTITVLGEVISYRVTDIRVVAPDETRHVDPVPGRDLVTLVTCTPIGINSERILVTGERVLPTPPEDIAAAFAGPAGPGLPWWALVIAVTLAALGVYVWRSGRVPAGPLRGRSSYVRPGRLRADARPL